MPDLERKLDEIAERASEVQKSLDAVCKDLDINDPTVGAQGHVILCGELLDCNTRLVAALRYYKEMASTYRTNIKTVGDFADCVKAMDKKALAILEGKADA